MDLIKALFVFIAIIMALVVGATLGVVLVPFAVFGVIYFVMRVITYQEEEI